VTSTAQRVRRIVLQPGEAYFGPGPAVIETVLGSCLSVVLRDPDSGFAAMSHCMLPRRGSAVKPLAADPEAYNYVDTCIPMLLELMASHGDPASLEVKVFGGADMFPPSLAGRAGAVGAENTAVAMDQLQARKLRVFRTDLGGNRGRHVRFDTETGEVFVRYLSSVRQAIA
jgi:chemotaxis receptor (MCP) glutamine deamidase CheD